MKDSDFKKLNHQIGCNVISSKGNEVTSGYKPDITVRDDKKTLKFILESEQKTDRKAFIGDLIKAEVFAEQEGANPILIIVMQESSNTTTTQIAKHLKPYKQWIADKKNGVTNIASVCVISDIEYNASISAHELIGSDLFNRRCHVI